MGRPTKTKEVRSQHVSFRLSPAEHFALLDKAERSGLTVGDFLRSRALKARSRKAREMIATPAEPGALSLAQQLRMIGVNVNQIAHHCNRHQVPPPDGLSPLLAEIRALLSTTFRTRG